MGDFILINGWTEKEVSISEIQTLLNEGYEVQVDSPDEWVDVNYFIDKGMWQEYILEVKGFENVRCNESHLFETKDGWKSAKELCDFELVEVLCNDGNFHSGVVYATENQIPIVDINVNHKNHRYYTNGISSHNTGVGKSLFMCHCASANLTAGLNVLYITMEMAEEKIAERIDANLLDISVEDLSSLPKDSYDKKMKRLKEKTKGKLIIKEYPTACAGSGNFRHLLNELKIKKSFVPDIIYIDYLNICLSTRLKSNSNANSYTFIKAIAEELRGLAVEYNVPIVSATQTTRSGYSNSDLGLEDTSESFGLPATADFMFALISTEELESLNQIMVKQLKNRYSDPSSNRRFVVGVDRDKMRLYNAEDNAQEDIVDGPLSQKNFDNSRLKELFSEV